MSDADLASLRGQRVLITGAARGSGPRSPSAWPSAARGWRSSGSSRRRWKRSPSAAARAPSWPRPTSPIANRSRRRSTRLPRRSPASTWWSPTPGSPPVGPCGSRTLRSWERVIEINLLGVMYTDRAALPHLERSRGYLLNIASTAAAFRAPGMTAYCAAKAGVEALSDCLRIEMTPYGVGVGVAYFLFLDTDMVNDSEREMPLLQRATRRAAELPRAEPTRSAPAIDEVVAAIARAPPPGRLPALVHPGPWALRQLFASRLSERRAAQEVPQAMADYEQLIAEKGVEGASATERTREIAGL